jgi:hypothetical protein
VKTLVLSKDFHSELVRTLKSSKTWKQAYEDDLGVVFTR